jgi:hypothetical protein
MHAFSTDSAAGGPGLRGSSMDGSERFLDGSESRSSAASRQSIRMLLRSTASGAGACLWATGSASIPADSFLHLRFYNISTASFLRLRFYGFVSAASPVPRRLIPHGFDLKRDLFVEYARMVHKRASQTRTKHMHTHAHP